LASLDDFLSVPIRVGPIVPAQLLRAPKPALRIDSGELGRGNANAPITDLYDAEDLAGLQVEAVMNLPPRRVAGLDSEVAVLAADNGRRERTPVVPERPVPDGVD
jgi:tRNA-binding protein